jgi:hypothetical protein
MRCLRNNHTETNRTQRQLSTNGKRGTDMRKQTMKRRSPLAMVVLVAMLGAILQISSASALRPNPGAPPVQRTDIEVLACNNSFSPTPFPLQWIMQSTVTAPVSSGDALPVYPGQQFTMSHTVTAFLAADFLAAAYAIIGPRQAPIDQARVTITPLAGATGPIVSIGTGVTGGFAGYNAPAPGRSVAVSWTAGSSTITAASGTPFVNANAPDGDIGRSVYDNTGENVIKGTITAVGGGGTTITVTGDGSVASADSAEGQTIQIWNPAELDDVAVPIGTASATYTALTADAPFNATFQVLGNSSYSVDGTGATPGFSAGGNSDPRTGTVQANTVKGITGTPPSTTVTNQARNTYLRVNLAPGVTPTIACMGGRWSALEVVDGSPAYGDPYRAPASFNGTTAGQGETKLGRLVAYSPFSADPTQNPGNTPNPYGSPNVLVQLDPTTPFTADEVGSPVMGSVVLDNAYSDFTGIPDTAVIAQVATVKGLALLGGATEEQANAAEAFPGQTAAIISAPVTKWGPSKADGTPYVLSQESEQLALAQQFGGEPPYDGNGLIDTVGGFATVNVTPEPPTVTIASIDGQETGIKTAGRAGNTINLGGSSWAKNKLNAAITVELCATGDTPACTTTGLEEQSVSTNGSGVLSGSVKLTSSATTGNRLLKVSITGESQSDDIALLVLGTPTLTLSSASGPVGAPINVTGSNWNPSSTPDIEALDDTSPTPVVKGTGAATVGATGSLTGSIIIPADTVAIRATDGGLTASQPFTINANAQVCGEDAPLSSCSLQQLVYLNIEASEFSFSQAQPFVVLQQSGAGCTIENRNDCDGLTLDGTTTEVTGSLESVSIIDARGTSAGWTVSMLITDLATGAGGTNKSIPPNRMVFTPACSVVDGNIEGGTAAVVTGAATTSLGSAGSVLSASVAHTVCSAASGASGGTFSLGGTLVIKVPPSLIAGPYTATITLTAV